MILPESLPYRCCTLTCFRTCFSTSISTSGHRDSRACFTASLTTMNSLCSFSEVSRSSVTEESAEARRVAATASLTTRLPLLAYSLSGVLPKKALSLPRSRQNWYPFLS